LEVTGRGVPGGEGQFGLCLRGTPKATRINPRRKKLSQLEGGQSTIATKKTNTLQNGQYKSLGYWSEKTAELKYQGDPGKRRGSPNGEPVGANRTRELPRQAGVEPKTYGLLAMSQNTGHKAPGM